MIQYLFEVILCNERPEIARFECLCVADAYNRRVTESRPCWQA